MPFISSVRYGRLERTISCLSCSDTIATCMHNYTPLITLIGLMS